MAMSLDHNEIHVWSSSLSRTPAELSELSSILSSEEFDRALRLRSDSKRVQYIVTRGTLRQLISRYLDIDPRRPNFSHGPQGKPFLEPPLSSLQFNVSHTGGMALFAFAWDEEIGVDVEKVRPFDNYLGFASRFFSEREVASLETIRDTRRMEAFFHVWTRKEAFLKATGTGISSGLARVEVTVDPESSCRLERLDGCERQASEWSLTALHPSRGYVGALCSRVKDAEIRCFDWTATPATLEVA